jgi:hypothetical protein
MQTQKEHRRSTAVTGPRVSRQEWIEQQLRQTPPLSPERRANLARLLAGARLRTPAPR